MERKEFMSTYLLNGIAVAAKLFDSKYVENGKVIPRPDTIVTIAKPKDPPPRRTYYYYDDIRQHAKQLPFNYTAAEYRKAFAPNANYYSIRRILKEVGKLQERGRA